MHHVPFVHTTHVLPSKLLDFGATDVVNIKILKSSLTESVIKQILISFYENCDALIALNSSAADDIRQFGYEGKIFMIPNGRDLKRYGVCRNADTSSQEKILTFIGYISQRKNQLYLLQVLKHLPGNYRLQIIGEPLGPSYDQRLKNFISENNLSNVILTGQVKHEDIPSYLEKTHVFVSASKMEIQSLVVIEALASGTPVVGLSNETIDELVDERVGFRLSKNTDPEEFAQCVERICNLPQPEYDKMCENARNRVKRLDWTNVMALTVEAYESLLRERLLVTNKGSTGLTNAIPLIPSGEAREILTEKVMSLEKAIQEKVDFEPRLNLASKIKQVKRVSRSTWLFAGLTISISLVSYLLLRSVSSASRMKRSTGLGRLDGLRHLYRQTGRQHRAAGQSDRRSARRL